MSTRPPAGAGTDGATAPDAADADEAARLTRRVAEAAARDPLAAGLHAHLTAGLAGHLALLERFVGINSFTLNAAGVDALGDATAAAFAPLGFAAERVAAADAAYGRHLVLRRPGPPGRRIGLVSHLDTVFTAEEEAANAFAWRDEGARIHGPGTIDIKGGTVVARMALDALVHVAPDVADGAEWLVLLDAAEERMAAGFGALARERLGADALACLVFESARLGPEELRLVTARKGMVTARVTTHGASAHAGNHHAAGANAIVQLARLVERLAALSDPARELTVNVGTVAGGTVRNRVPHEAAVALEIRAFDPAALDEAAAAVADLAGPGDVSSPDGSARCHVTVTIEGRQPPWPSNPGSERLFEAWSAAAARVGLRAVAERRGGLSDGNRTWARVPTLDGLGPSGAHLHASVHDPARGLEQEYVEPASLVPKALVTALALCALVRGAPERAAPTPENAR